MTTPRNDETIPPFKTPPRRSKPWLRWGLEGGVFLLLGVCVGLYLLSTLEASTRSKWAQTMADMRSLGTAIEAYYLDSSSYPAWSTDPDEVLQSDQTRFIDLTQQPTFRLKNGTGLQTLTTPVAYITQLYMDSLPPSPHLPFRYYAVMTDPELQHDTTQSLEMWIMWSAGVDKVYDLNLALLRRLASTEPSQLTREGLAPYTWDPSNGTTSAGDLWRIKQ